MGSKVLDSQNMEEKADLARQHAAWVVSVQLFCPPLSFSSDSSWQPAVGFFSCLWTWKCQDQVYNSLNAENAQQTWLGPGLLAESNELWEARLIRKDEYGHTRRTGGS